MSTASGQDSTFENQSYSKPRSRRVGLTSPPSSFRLSTSTTSTGTFESAFHSTPPSSPSPSSPPRPPRSPLRPTTASGRRSSVSLFKCELSDFASESDMSLSHSRSFGSISGLLNPQPSSLKSRVGRPQSPDGLPVASEPLIAALAINDSDHDREDAASYASGSGSGSAPSPLLQPSTGVSKRTHALQELLSTERAYASDLALIRDIHIPLALGQTVEIHPAPATPPASSGSSLRTQSSSDSSSGHASCPPGPAMSREDVRIIFNNVGELAAFADAFTEQIEEALGSVLEGGSGEDHVGALFLEKIPTLEPLYLAYITKHPAALEHLNNLPQTPELQEYLKQSRALASSLTHAWDLPSLLIKPVQRLLKYSLLLSAIIDETSDAHPDKANLRTAREKMEEVAHAVNEGQRRREVVKEVLNGASSNKPNGKRQNDPKAKPKKKGLNVGVAASVSLGRMKSISSKSIKIKNDAEASQEAEEVQRLGEEVKSCEAFIRTFAKRAIEWSRTVRALMEHLSSWSKSFGQVIGVAEADSEAFDAFLQVVTTDLFAICEEYDQQIEDHYLTELTKLVDSTLAPLRLLEAMKTLEPLHFGLLNLNQSKSRPPPQLVEASQSYVALRAQLASELPRYLALLHRGITLCVVQFATWQAKLFEHLRDRWLVLWDALKVEGEMNAGAAETLRVWWGRFADVEENVFGLNIVQPIPERRQENGRQKAAIRIKPVRLDDDWSETSSTVVVSSIITSIDDPPSSPSSLSLQTPASAKARSVRSMDVGNGRSRGLERRNSNESMRSKKSGKSVKSVKTVGHTPSHSLGATDIAYGYTGAPTLPPPCPKPMYSRTKSMPIPAPLPLKKANSQGRALDEVISKSRSKHPPEPQDHRAKPNQYDADRGRPSRKPSLKRRLTESLRAGSSSSYNRRSPSVTSAMSPSSSPSASSFMKNSPSSSRHRSRPPGTGAKVPALYVCRAIHPCEPPPGVSYRELPFFTLRVGDEYEVLQEAGHPSTHKDLPLYVDDGEDCLLLVRNPADDIGWALASFLIPKD
ncbi:hypothetical protein WOLCODRAFT_133926 [Wolfiporia cocos MD-104 SS10]|uniref:DH domain-containing protein n=1 Tax=Wolfiporia cocos (strain MD-104) TaxID=742152 RepID=A0A2H3J0E5_WOLCO|nr:hypothetical protein WOLCODRAFT_133926 [Wolfiporia cocos MD-104 SS10]